MRTLLQNIQQAFSESPLAQLALLITILVGFFTIVKGVWEIGVGAYRLIRACIAWWYDRKVFHFLKTVQNPGALHEVSEIAESIKRKPLKVLHSLRRLEQKEKVQCLNVDESASGLWGLHSLER